MFYEGKIHRSLIDGNTYAARLLMAGYQLHVFNRTKEKATGLLFRGAVWCTSPANVAVQIEIIISMVSTPRALEEITLGNNGILSKIQDGAIYIDCSTVSPELTKQLAEAYQLKGCQFLHSPVLGSVSQVIEGSLLLFVGGNNDAFKRV